MQQRMIQLQLEVPASLITSWVNAQWRREAIGLPWQSIDDYYAAQVVQSEMRAHMQKARNRLSHFDDES